MLNKHKWKGGGKEKRRERGWERGEEEDKGKPGRSNKEKGRKDL